MHINPETRPGLNLLSNVNAVAHTPVANLKHVFGFQFALI